MLQGPTELLNSLYVIAFMEQKLPSYRILAKDSPFLSLSFKNLETHQVSTGQTTHTVSKIKILNVTMKKISKELNQLNQQKQSKITDVKMFFMTYCPSFLE